MKIGEYKTQKTREIIEDTISQLCAVGFSLEGAATLRVVQGITHVRDSAKRKELAEWVALKANDSGG